MAAGSLSAALVDGLYYLYMGIALVVGALVIGWLLVALVRFRARPGMERPADAPRAGVLPAERGHPIWSYVMALIIAAIMFGLAFGTISAVHTLEEPPHEGERVELAIVGFQFGWRVTYTGDGGVLVPKVNEWTVPVDTPVVATVRSQDVWHNFAIPAYRVRIDAIPGETNHIWFQATETAEIQPVCVQICGTGHALMKSKMHVVSKADFAAYLANQSALEYQKIERANNVLNVTFDGATFVVEQKTVNFSKAAALRITNAAATAQAFSIGVNERTIAAGETAFLTPSAGACELKAGTATQTLAGCTPTTEQKAEIHGSVG